MRFGSALVRFTVTALALINAIGCDRQPVERLYEALGGVNWQIRSSGVGPIRFGMTPEEVENAIGTPMVRSDREDDDCDAWSPSGRRALRIIFWDRRVAVFDVGGISWKTPEGVGVSTPIREVERRLGALLRRPNGVPDYAFPVEARFADVPADERLMAFEVAGGKVSAVVLGDTMLVRNCTLTRRLRATRTEGNTEIASVLARAGSYDRSGSELPHWAKAALSQHLGSWRLALPSQGDIERCHSDRFGDHPAWVEGDFDSDGRADVAAQVSSYGRGGTFLLLAAGNVVEAELFVGYAGPITRMLRKGETAKPIDEPEFVLRTDAVLLIECEKSAALLALEDGHVRKAWLSD